MVDKLEVASYQSGGCRLTVWDALVPDCKIRPCACGERQNGNRQDNGNERSVCGHRYGNFSIFC
jgi:hypothetical protein